MHPCWVNNISSFFSHDMRRYHRFKKGHRNKNCDKNPQTSSGASKYVILDDDDMENQGNSGWCHQVSKKIWWIKCLFSFLYFSLLAIGLTVAHFFFPESGLFDGFSYSGNLVTYASSQVTTIYTSCLGVRCHRFLSFLCFHDLGKLCCYSWGWAWTWTWRKQYYWLRRHIYTSSRQSSRQRKIFMSTKKVQISVKNCA